MDDTTNKGMKETIDKNTHELYVLSMDELDKVIQVQAPLPAKAHQRSVWDNFRAQFEATANYTATGKDLATLSKLFSDLGFAGTKAYVKYYQGRPYVIFKGQPGLRKIFTGTRYGLQNAKIIQMGLGKHGAMQAAKSGGFLTILLVGAFRVADFILSDQMTLNQLIGTLATDVVKIGIATGASIVAASAAAAVFTVAVGPIVAAIGVGVLVSYGLGKLDEHYGLTNKVIAALDQLEADARAALNQREQQLIQAASDVVENAIDYAVDTARKIIINTAKHYIYRTIPQW